MNRIMSRFGMKWRAGSISRPRQAKRVQSVMDTQGAVHSTLPAGAWRKTAGGSSWRSVWMP